jgi:RNA polymerase sigma factor (sigma-70 family)
MIDDAELLRRYAREKFEPAFAELVQRHVNFVYAAALRRVGGDAHLAEDVTQQVFTALARGAAGLANHPVLSGWLYTTTRNCAAQVVRSERRRQAREHEAHSMNEITGFSSSVSHAEWERLRPVIDDAVDELGEADRQAVLLRFFEGKSFADVGAKLRVTENAARMRVERALDKLHALLARRGVTSTTAALATAIAGQPTVAAPAALAGAIAAMAVAGVSAGTGTGAGALLFTMTKLKAGLIAALVVAGGVVVTLELRNPPPSASEAEGAENLDRAKSVAEKSVTKIQPKPENVPLAPPQPAIVAAPAPQPVAEVDPNAGMIPVEKLVNAGRATPGAAFETMTWAALTGDDNELAAALTLSNEAREKAAVWRAALPPEDQKKFVPLEKLPAIFLAEEALRKAKGMQVLGVTDEEGDRATLHVRTWSVKGNSSDAGVPMVRGKDGWQMIIPENMIDGMRRQFERTRFAPPPSAP